MHLHSEALTDCGLKLYQSVCGGERTTKTLLDGGKMAFLLQEPKQEAADYFLKYFHHIGCDEMPRVSKH